MANVVSITSQGQVTIPAKIRRRLELEKYEKASVRAEGQKIIIEPLPDLLGLGGSLKERALKGKSIAEIIRLEERAASQTRTKKRNPR